MTSIDASVVHGLLIPLPQATNAAILQKSNIPRCFLYAPPTILPPLPASGKEGKILHARRKWAYKSEKYHAKGGIRGKAFDALDNGMAATRSATVEFLTRCPGKKTLREIQLHYPADMPESDLKSTFESLLLTTKHKTDRNTLISGILLPITFTIDIFCVFWPLPGPFFPIDAVAFYSSVQGRRQASYILKSSVSGELKITFIPDPSLSVAVSALEQCVRERAYKKGHSGLVSNINPPAVTDAEIEQMLASSLGASMTIPQDSTTAPVSLTKAPLYTSEAPLYTSTPLYASDPSSENPVLLSATPLYDTAAPLYTSVASKTAPVQTSAAAASNVDLSDFKKQMKKASREYVRAIARKRNNKKTPQ